MGGYGIKRSQGSFQQVVLEKNIGTGICRNGLLREKHKVAFTARGFVYQINYFPSVKFHVGHFYLGRGNSEPEKPVICQVIVHFSV
jgi:hypothetical protein